MVLRTPEVGVAVDSVEFAIVVPVASRKRGKAVGVLVSDVAIGGPASLGLDCLLSSGHL